MVPLDVTDPASIQAAVKQVRERLDDGLDGNNNNKKLEGFVSNAGILWGYTLEELLDVCTVGVANVVDAFLPLMNPDGERVIIVSSGLSPPLMHSFSTHQDVLLNGNWDDADSTRVVITITTTATLLLKKLMAHVRSASSSSSTSSSGKNEVVPTLLTPSAFPAAPLPKALPTFTCTVWPKRLPTRTCYM
jgi:NAD(P)-dependent dehydrogenase (short-subunit alcohol dehydrogenase family)